MERRLFLKLALLGIAEAGLAGCSTFAPLVPAQKNAKKEKLLVFTANDTPGFSTVRVTDWDGYTYAELPVPMAFPHSFYQDHEEPHVIYLFEFLGSFAKLNLLTGSCQKLDHRETLDISNGHGLQSRSGEFLLCSQTDKTTHHALALRSSKTLKKIATTPTECRFVHQVVQLPGTDIGACGNIRTPDNEYGGSLTFYDYEKRQVINRIPSALPINHLLPLSSTEVLGMTCPLDPNMQNNVNDFANMSDSAANIKSLVQQNHIGYGGQILYARTDGTSRIIKDAEIDSTLKGGFSMAHIAKSEEFLASYSFSNQVILWKAGKAAKIFSVFKPTTIIVNADCSKFMVLSDQKLLRVFSLNTGEELDPLFKGQQMSRLKYFYKYYD